MMPSAVAIDAIAIMAAGGGLTLLGAVMARLLFRPHYTPVDNVQVIQGMGNRIESPIVDSLGADEC